MAYLVSLYVRGQKRVVEVLGHYQTREEATFHGEREIARVKSIPLTARNPTFDFADRFTIAKVTAK